MRIRLLHSYSGVLTNERRMAEGEHDVPVELGEYLIANGHAVAIVLPQAGDNPADSTDTPSPVSKKRR